MEHILVPVEARHETRTRSAIEQAVRLYREKPCVIHLLLVQPPVSGHVSMLFDADRLHALLADWGAEDLQPAQLLLLEAGVPFISAVLIGPSAKTIAAAARTFSCSRIVFGAEPARLGQRLFGTIAQQVRHLLQAQNDPQVVGS